MAGVNKVIIVGNIGKEPEVRYTKGGDAIVNCSVATSETWKDKNTGQKQEKTEWHRVCFFGGVAKIASEYLHKGSKIYIEGKLQTRSWDDSQTGQKKYATEIVVDGFKGVLQMLDSRGDNQGQGQGQGSPSYEQQPRQQQPTQNDFDADIPF